MPTPDTANGNATATATATATPTTTTPNSAANRDRRTRFLRFPDIGRRTRRHSHSPTKNAQTAASAGAEITSNKTGTGTGNGLIITSLVGHHTTSSPAPVPAPPIAKVRVRPVSFAVAPTRSFFSLASKGPSSIDTVSAAGPGAGPGPGETPTDRIALAHALNSKARRAAAAALGTSVTTTITAGPTPIPTPTFGPADTDTDTDTTAPTANPRSHPAAPTDAAAKRISYTYTSYNPSLAGSGIVTSSTALSGTLLSHAHAQAQAEDRRLLEAAVQASRSAISGDDATMSVQVMQLYGADVKEPGKEQESEKELGIRTPQPSAVEAEADVPAPSASVLAEDDGEVEAVVEAVSRSVPTPLPTLALEHHFEAHTPSSNQAAGPERSGLAHPSTGIAAVGTVGRSIPTRVNTAGTSTTATTTIPTPGGGDSTTNRYGFIVPPGPATPLSPLRKRSSLFLRRTSYSLFFNTPPGSGPAAEANSRRSPAAGPTSPLPLVLPRRPVTIPEKAEGWIGRKTRPVSMNVTSTAPVSDPVPNSLTNNDRSNTTVSAPAGAVAASNASETTSQTQNRQGNSHGHSHRSHHHHRRRHDFRRAVLPRLRRRHILDSDSDPDVAEAEAEQEARRVRKEGQRHSKWLRMAGGIAPSAGGGDLTSCHFDTLNPKLISRTWKGVPDTWRASAWYSFLDASVHRWWRQLAGSAGIVLGPNASSATLARFDCPHLPLAHNTLVSHFHALQAVPCIDDVQIDRDVPRTISKHILFRDRYRGGQRSLFRVLHALALHSPDTGYVQGMGPLAVTLLCYYPEHTAFVMMVRLWRLRGLQWLYQPDFGNLIDTFGYVKHTWMGVGDSTVAPAACEAANRLSDMAIEPLTYATKWYLTIFHQSLPFPTQLRVWDVVMLMGDPDVADKAGLAVTVPARERDGRVKMQTDAWERFVRLSDPPKPGVEVVKEERRAAESVGPKARVRAAHDSLVPDPVSTKPSPEISDAGQQQQQQHRDPFQIHPINTATAIPHRQRSFRLIQNLSPGSVAADLAVRSGPHTPIHRSSKQDEEQQMQKSGVRTPDTNHTTTDTYTTAGGENYTNPTVRSLPFSLSPSPLPVPTGPRTSPGSALCCRTGQPEHEHEHEPEHESDVDEGPHTPCPHPIRYIAQPPRHSSPSPDPVPVSSPIPAPASIAPVSESSSPQPLVSVPSSPRQQQQQQQHRNRLKRRSQLRAPSVPASPAAGTYTPRTGENVTPSTTASHTTTGTPTTLERSSSSHHRFRQMNLHLPLRAWTLPSPGSGSGSGSTTPAPAPARTTTSLTHRRRSTHGDDRLVDGNANLPAAAAPPPLPARSVSVSVTHGKGGSTAGTRSGLSSGLGSVSGSLVGIQSRRLERVSASPTPSPCLSPERITTAGPKPGPSSVLSTPPPPPPPPFSFSLAPIHATTTAIIARALHPLIVSRQAKFETAVVALTRQLPVLDDDLLMGAVRDVWAGVAERGRRRNH